MRKNGERVRAGVIGVGHMGRNHARVYSELQGVELVGVADLDTEAARQVAREHGTEQLDIETLLSQADVVSVAVPTFAHYDVVRSCLDRNVHVLVEKPFVADREQGRDLIERAERARVTLQVGHIERFNPAVRTLSAIRPDLDIIALDARRLGPPLDGGRNVEDSVVMDLMIHDIDVILSLVGGDVASVCASGAIDGQYATAILEFDGGEVASLTASRVTQRKVRQLGVTARDAQVDVDYIDQSVFIHRHSLPEYIREGGEVRYRHEGVVERPMVETGEPLKLELRSFVEAATTGSKPVVSADDALRAIAVAETIDRIAFGSAVKEEVSPR